MHVIDALKYIGIAAPPTTASERKRAQADKLIADAERAEERQYHKSRTPGSRRQRATRGCTSTPLQFTGELTATIPSTQVAGRQ
jgi:hypothetical protein